MLTREEFGEIFAKHGFKRTIRQLRAKGVANDDAYEHAQAAWMKAWERRADLKQDAALEGWVDVTAIRGFVSSRRSLQVNQIPDNYDEPVAPDFNEESLHIRGAFSRLLPQYQQVLLLKSAGYDARQIATKLGRTTPEAVYQRIKRAKVSLRILLDLGNHPAKPEPNR